MKKSDKLSIASQRLLIREYFSPLFMAVLWHIYGSRQHFLGVLKSYNQLIIMIIANSTMADCSFLRKKLLHDVKCDNINLYGMRFMNSLDVVDGKPVKILVRLCLFFIKIIWLCVRK